MSQKGTHTWDIIIHYHQCPHCEKIIEIRKNYSYAQGSYFKDVICPFCTNKTTFIQTKKVHPKSLLGSEEPVEWDWPETS